jgi:hypothetical protein
MAIFDQAHPDEPGVTPDGVSGEQRIATLLKHLFRQYAIALDYDCDQMRQVKMKAFVLWCNLHDDWHQDETTREMLKKELSLVNEDIEAVRVCFEDPWTAASILYPYWHMLCLSGQPPIKNVPSFIHLSFVLGFNAGTPTERALQIQVPTRWTPGKAMTNGFLCSLVRDQFDGIIQTIAGNGVDAMYEKHAMPIGGATPSVRRALTPDEKPRGSLGL